MSPETLLGELEELASEVGLRVVSIPARAAREGEPPASSGVCQVRGDLWVLLAAGESAASRSEVLARALREHCSEALERRYLPPAIRDLLDPDKSG